MSVIQPKRIIPFIIIICIVLLFLTAVNYFFQKQNITGSVISLLRKSLKSNGLTIDIKQVHWSNINEISASEVVLKDLHDGTILFIANKIDLQLNLYNLISNRLHPESALQEILLENPQFTLEHFENGTFNFSSYFTGGKKALLLKMKLKVKNGLVKLEDYRYGSYLLQGVDGLIDLGSYPLIKWKLNGDSDFSKGMNWSSTGKFRADQLAGIGEFQTNQIALSKLLPLIPYQSPYKIRSGSAKLALNFAWNKKAIWIEQGKADVSNAIVLVPKFSSPFHVQKLDATFSPRRIKVKNLRLIHERSFLKASGEIDTVTTKINAKVSAKQLNFEDLTKFISMPNKLTYKGLANIRLGVSGTFSEPIMDGELFINNTELFLEGRKTIEQLSGKVIVNRNNLKIERLEGSWNNSPIGIYGSISNLLNPQMNLKFYGYGLNLQPEEVALLSKYELTTKGDINFSGEILGEPRNPKIIGEIVFDQISYREIPIDKFKVKLEWDSMLKNLKVLDINGRVWEGQISAKGEIKINTKGVKWQVSGNLSDLNAGATPYSKEVGINGKISADLIFKGDWKVGTPFQIGDIFGIFKGEKLAYKYLAMKEANGVFSLVDGILSIDSLHAQIGDGTVFGHLSWNPSMVQLNLNAENINVQQFLPDKKQYPVNGTFNGNLVFEGPPKEIEGKINGVFSEISWDSKPVGTFSGTLDYSNQVLTIVDSHLITEFGDCILEGYIDLNNSPNLNVILNSDNLRLKGFLPWLPQKQSFNLNGNAGLKLALTGELFNPTIHGEVRLDSPEIGPLSMDKGFIKINGNVQKLVLTDFYLNQSNTNSEIRMTGTINPKNLDLEFEGNSIDITGMHLKAAGRELTGVVSFKGQVTGTLTKPLINTRVLGENLTFGEFAFRKLEGQIVWDSKTIQISNANLTQGESRIDFRGQIIPTSPIQLNLELKGTSIDLKEVMSNLDIKQKSLELDGKVSGFIKINGRLENPHVEINGDFSDVFFNNLPISGDFALVYDNNKVTIQRILLKQDTGTLLAEGIWEPGKIFNLEVGLQDFPLEVINSFINPSYRFTGKVNSFILLQWSNSGISGDYRIEVNDFGLNNSQLGVLKMNGNFYDQGLLISEGDITNRGTNLNVEGYLPWPPNILEWLKLPVVSDSNSRDFNMSFLFKSFPADLVSAFIPNVIATNGTLNGKLTLQGTFLKPRINGNLGCNGVSLNIQGLPYPIDGLQATVLFDGYKAEVQNIKGNYGKGKFSINGSLDYQDLKLTRFDFGINGSNLYYENHYFDGYGDLNLNLNGNFVDTIISGDIKVYNCRIGILGLTPNKNSKPFPWNPALSVHVKTGKNVRYRQMGMADIDIRSSIQVKGRILEPKIEGEAESNKGILTFYGQTFRVTKGKATFNYSEGYLPYIEVDSNLKTPEAVVFLTIRGQVGSPNMSINLTSQPFLSQSDLFSMLNWSDLSGDKPFTVNGALLGNAGFVTDTLFGDVFFELRSALNLDMLYLEPNYQQNDLRLNVGRYMTNEFFLSYSRSFSDLPKEKWGLDYQLTPQLTLGGSFSLLDGTYWRLVYRFSF